MQQWRVTVTMTPMAYNKPSHLIVEADSEEDALLVAAYDVAGVSPIRHVTRSNGSPYIWTDNGYVVEDATPYVPHPAPPGRVIRRL